MIKFTVVTINWNALSQTVLCRFDRGKADKRVLYMLPSRRLCMDGNFFMSYVTLFYVVLFSFCQCAVVVSCFSG